MFFGCCCCCFLCCYVVKLGKAKKNRNPQKRDPPKSGSTSGYFLQDKLWLHVPKLLLFFELFSCFFACWSKNTIKIGFFDDFEMLIFSFFGQKSRVNNLAGVGSITWPDFGPKFCTKIRPGY